MKNISFTVFIPGTLCHGNTFFLSCTENNDLMFISALLLINRLFVYYYNFQFITEKITFVLR